MSKLGDLRPRTDSKPARPEKAGEWGPSAEQQAALRTAHNDAISNDTVYSALATLGDSVVLVVVGAVFCAVFAACTILIDGDAGMWIGGIASGVALVAGFVLARQLQRRGAAAELARVRVLPIPLDLPEYITLLATTHPEKGRVRVVVWFESAPSPEQQEAWASAARTHGVTDVEWESADEQLRLTSEFLTLQKRDEDGWDPDNRPIHRQVRKILTQVVVPQQQACPLHSVQVRIV